MHEIDTFFKNLPEIEFKKKTINRLYWRPTSSSQWPLKIDLAGDVNIVQVFECTKTRLPPPFYPFLHGIFEHFKIICDTAADCLNFDTLVGGIFVLLSYHRIGLSSAT